LKTVEYCLKNKHLSDKCVKNVKPVLILRFRKRKKPQNLEKAEVQKIKKNGKQVCIVVKILETSISKEAGKKLSIGGGTEVL